MKQTSIFALSLLAIAANIVGIVQFGQEQPWLYTILVTLIVLLFISFFFARFRSFLDLKKILREAENSVRELNVMPHQLIAFDRSSAIFAGMLGQRLSIGRILVLPRSASAVSEFSPRSIIVGAGVNVALDSADLHSSLVVVFHLRTGATLEAGLKAITPVAGGSPAGILAFYASPGGLARWPNVKVVRVCRPGEAPDESLPWISGPYNHL